MGKSIFDIDVNMKANTFDANVDGDITYYNLDNEYMLGQAFRNGFERLPKGVYVSDNVEELKKHPAGLNIIFKTNSTSIKLKSTLAGGAYMSHMTAVGTIGFSLYVLNKGNWVFVNSTKTSKTEYQVTLVDNADKKERTYRLYMPLYQTLLSAYIGINNESKFSFLKPKMDNLVIYGTSISQGGCATRPGMDYGAILGRLLNMNVINLGFSGSCKIEHVMTDVLNQIEKKVLLLELESNSPSYEHMTNGVKYMLENLQNKDDFKIYIVSHFTEGRVLLDANLRKYRDGFKEVQKSFEGITFIDGEEITKELGYEGTVDGVHLTDLGFYHLAKKLAKIIK